MKPVLAYVEHHLPASTTGARLELAHDAGLALEVAYRRGTDLEPFLRSGLALPTLQAFEMHELHPLHPDPARRRAAVPYVEEVIDAAAAGGIPRVLTACGFGALACAEPFESCAAFYREAIRHARTRGVRLLIELLSPLRAPAMTDPADVQRLVAELAAPDTVGVAVDLGHLADAGHDPDALLPHWPGGIEELQLRGPRSTPPAPSFPLAATLRALPAPPTVVCVEHREPIRREAFTTLVRHLHAELEGAESGPR